MQSLTKDFLVTKDKLKIYKSLLYIQKFVLNTKEQK